VEGSGDAETTMPVNYFLQTEIAPEEDGEDIGPDAEEGLVVLQIDANENYVHDPDMVHNHEFENGDTQTTRQVEEEAPVPQESNTDRRQLTESATATYGPAIHPMFIHMFNEFGLMVKGLKLFLAPIEEEE